MPPREDEHVGAKAMMQPPNLIDAYSLRFASEQREMVSRARLLDLGQSFEDDTPIITPCMSAPKSGVACPLSWSG